MLSRMLKMLSLRFFLLLATGLYMNVKIHVCGVELTEDAFAAGNVKSEMVLHQAYLKIIRVYNENFWIIEDPAKEEAKDQEKTEMEKKLSEFRTKHVDKLETDYEELLKEAKAYIGELIKPGGKEDKEKTKAKKEAKSKYSKKKKEFMKEYGDTKKSFHSAFKYVNGRMGANKSLSKNLVKQFHLSKFTELAAHVYVVIAYSRNDEHGASSKLGGGSSYTCEITSVYDVANVLKEIEANTCDFLKDFLQAAKAPIETMESKIDKELTAIVVAGVKQSKQNKEDAKKTLEDAKKILVEIRDEYKKVKTDFEKYKDALIDFYKKNKPEAKIGSEARAFKGLVKSVNSKVPETWDGFLACYITAAIAAVAISSIAKNGKSDL